MALISLALFGNYYVNDAIGPIAHLFQPQRGFTDTRIGMLNAIYSLLDVVLVLVRHRPAYPLDRGDLSPRHRAHHLEPPYTLRHGGRPPNVRHRVRNPEHQPHHRYRRPHRCPPSRPCHGRHLRRRAPWLLRCRYVSRIFRPVLRLKLAIASDHSQPSWSPPLSPPPSSTGPSTVNRPRPPPNLNPSSSPVSSTSERLTGTCSSYAFRSTFSVTRPRPLPRRRRHHEKARSSAPAFVATPFFG